MKQIFHQYTVLAQCPDCAIFGYKIVAVSHKGVSINAPADQLRNCPGTFSLAKWWTLTRTIQTSSGYLKGKQPEIISSRQKCGLLLILTTLHWMDRIVRRWPHVRKKRDSMSCRSSGTTEKSLIGRGGSRVADWVCERPKIASCAPGAVADKYLFTMRSRVLQRTLNYPFQIFGNDRRYWSKTCLEIICFRRDPNTDDKMSDVHV